MKLSKLYAGALLAFGLVFGGCSGGGGSSDSSVSSFQTAVINGAVNDAPVAFAQVRLVVHPSGEELANIIADIDGKWSFTISKELIPANAFIIIYAVNPDNNSTIRSVIDTDEVLESEGDFVSDETTVSHYTEAAVAMAETATGINQEEFDNIKSLIILENDEPVNTGYQQLDELAAIIQISFDDVNSSQDELSLAIYKTLLQEKVSTVVPDEFGGVSIELPVAYNDEINIDANLSTGAQVGIVDDKIIFDLTPEEAQSDVNLTITATLNSVTITETLTLYAKGNSEDHYIHQAVAPSSEPTTSQTTVMINGRYYTMIAYSFISVDESNANFSAITIDGSLREKSFTTLKIADNYANSKVLVKVYEGKETFDFTTLVGDSGITLLTSNQINISNIDVTRVNDFRPIEPTDASIELPPVAPQF